MTSHSQLSFDDPVDVGIVVALEREIGLFLYNHPEHRRQEGNQAVFLQTSLNNTHIGIAITGPGQDRATMGTRALCDAMHPRWIISVGYGGALLPQLKVADAVFIEEVVTSSDEHMKLGGRYPFSKGEVPCRVNLNGQSLRVLQGSLYSTDRIISSITERTEIAKKHGAAVVDMETSAVIQVARDRHIPVLAMRAISDDLQTELPSEIARLLEKEGASRWGALSAALWKKPKLVKLLWKLKQDTLLASETLAGALEYLISNLPTGEKSANSNEVD
ncbi:MAG: hypothetical protein KDA65_13260 [Planctomycetaceae bacterium]|nr:hypothetical protein [Planctomycetaceae bacterium]